jgi:hypothetical protein
MLRRVALVRTDVPEERSASIIRATRIGEPGTLVVISNWGTLRRNTDDGGATSSETSVVTRATRRTQYSDIHSYNIVHKYNLHVQLCNTDVCKKRVINLGIKIFNGLPL